MKDAIDAAAEVVDLAQQNKLRGQDPRSLDEVCAAFSSYLYLESLDPVRVLLAAYVANRFSDADPVWFFFVAPPSSAKTEFLMSLEKVPGVHVISTLTTNTLLSGHQAKNSSLLHRIGDGTILIQKDFTSILALRSDDRNIIFGQLREVYDGKFVREVGMAKSAKWEGKLGFISGCTLEIENSMMLNGKLGDRFLYYRVPDSDEDKVLARVRANSSRRTSEQRDVLKSVVAAFLEHLPIPPVPPEIPSHVYEAVTKIARFAVRLRTPVERDQYSSAKTITAVYQHESPARFVKELITFAGALAVLRSGTWSDDDWPLLSRIVFDSVASRRLKPVEFLYDRGGLVTAELADAMQMPRKTILYTMDELMAARIIVRKLVPRGQLGNRDALADGDDRSGDSTYLWTLADDIRAMLNFRYSLKGEAPARLPDPPAAAATEEALF